MSKRSLYILPFFLLTGQVSADSFVFEHPDCKIRFLPSEHKEIAKIARQELKERKFKVLELINGKALIGGELYYSLDLTKDKKLYKSCIITSSILMASDRLPRENDKVLYKKEIKRSLPRITFYGDERCRMAIKETFIHIPTCKKIGFAD